jgi:hypothetical protein
MAGTGLFGWCLTDMPLSQHEQCIHTFEYASPITCPCMCHTDLETFKKSLVKVSVTKKGRKKK